VFAIHVSREREHQFILNQEKHPAQWSLAETRKMFVKRLPSGKQ